MDGSVFIGGFKEVTPYNNEKFAEHIYMELPYFALMKNIHQIDQALPGIFRAHLQSSPEIAAIEGITSFSDDDLDKDLISRQGVIFGYMGKCILGKYLFHKNYALDDVNRVKGFKIVGHFKNSSIVVPLEPFTQLRLVEKTKGRWVLGHIFTTFADTPIIFAKMLGIGLGLDLIAYKSIVGHLPYFEHISA